MKYQSILAGICLPSMAFAYPGMASKEDMLRILKEREAAPEAKNLEDRQLSGLVSGLTGAASALLNDVEGLLGSVAASVDEDNLRPQPGYEFIAPGPNDSRGPCPGLNLLANYGYLPRDGHVTAAEVIQAVAEGFNMGADLATVLVVFAVLADGDIPTESWYLGSGPGSVGGLNRHSTVEADVSPNREDFYNGCGDNHHLSSRMFTQNVGFAASSLTKDFGLETMTRQYSANAAFSKNYNPYLYYFPFPSIVSFVAFAFYPQYFSNGTYGLGGVANYESISSIIGAKLNGEGHYEYVPERWPENWYRRSFEYGAVQALADGIPIYLSNPIVMGVGQVGTPNLTPTTVLCDLYQGINSIVPLFISGTEEEIANAATWAISMLDGAFDFTTLGCPSSVLSPNLFSNASMEGGALNPPPSIVSNAANNVYNKVYFTATPTAPLCNHAAASNA